MTQTDFLQFEQKLLSLCSDYGVWVKSQQQYSEQPKDNIHYRDIILKAKINEKLYTPRVVIDDITESGPKT